MRQADLFENAVTQFQIARRTDVPGVRNVYVDDALNSGRPGAHHERTIRELNGFFDIVCHEDDGFLFGLPDAKEFNAHDEARDGIERTEWLIQETHGACYRT